MAGRSATLTVKIVSDAKGAAAGFADAESRVDRFQSGLNKASAVAGGVLAGIGLMGKAALDSASALQQASGAAEAVWKDQAGFVDALAKNSDTRLGLSEADYKQYAAVVGAQLQNMGFAGADAVSSMNILQTTGADLAAQFGGSTSDAVEALSSLLRGERDPIEKYGISISQAAVDAKVAALGLDTSSEAAKKHSDAVATMALVADQGATAQGAFARETNTAAGAQQIAAASFENAKAQLGDVLLPIVAAAAGKFAEFTGFLTENKDVVLAVVAVVATLAAATLGVNAALSAYRTIVIIATAMQWLWNAAMAANPIMLIVLAIAAVVGAIILAYNKFDWFKNIVDSVGDALVWAFNVAKDAIQWVLDKLSWIGDAASWVGDLFSAPQTMAVTPVAAGDAAGLFGAADATGAWAPIRGASLSSLPGGTSPSAGQGSGVGTIVNVTINGALDPVSVGRQIEKVLRDYGRATGRQLTLTMGTA